MHENYSEVVLIVIISSALILSLGIILVVGLLIQQKRKLQHQQQLTDIRNRHERSQLELRLKIQDETFQAISQNLHDNIGSNISTAMLLLYKDDQVSNEEEQMNRKLALGMLDRIIDDLKNIARSLNPNYLNDIGLTEAIQQRAEQLRKTKRFDIDLQFNDSPHRLERQKQLILFYIFQEAINNIYKHSQAKSILINLLYQPDQVTMRIKDDGKGMMLKADDERVNGKGSGLINMKNHAELIGANLKIDSSRGSGTEVLVTVPEPYV
jgi:two-component system, NarL family, sensor kinase